MWSSPSDTLALPVTVKTKMTAVTVLQPLLLSELPPLPKATTLLLFWFLSVSSSSLSATPVASGLVVEPVSVFVSANVTLKKALYLSCKDTPFSFARFELPRDVFSNWTELSHALAARYVSALYAHAGWVLGSLELLGSPVAFARSLGRGLSDLVRLPYEGLTRSPALFMVGVSRGAASFVRQVSSGALGSVTNMAASIARNMEHLSMDPAHASYQEHRRRQGRGEGSLLSEGGGGGGGGSGFVGGLASGVSSFGLSLVSAVAGLVDQPMQSFQARDESSSTSTAAATAAALLKGVGKGLLGVVTKLVGGAMDLVSKAGQGIMRGTGLAQELGHTRLPAELVPYLTMQERKALLRSPGGQER